MKYLIIILLVIVSCSNNIETNIENQNVQEKINVLEDGTKYLVHPNNILSGGPPKDGIPSIDNPQYVTVSDADEWINDNELVMAIEYKGIKRVYPLQIMVWHEIVNDKFNDEAILITYCPLCGSGIAYKPIIKGETTEFGTSGKLYNSNLLMYDRKTNTYWTQIDGKAIIGELSGEELEAIAIDTVVWRDYKKVHNDAQVLSQNTGFSRDYGRDPYGNYYEDSFLLFPVNNKDSRIHPKTIIFGIEIDGEYVAYKESDLIKKGIITDFVAGKKITLVRDEVGIVTITDEDKNEIIKERSMWFSWYAFHPKTRLYEQ